jgi:hypothetical protein
MESVKAAPSPQVSLVSRKDMSGAHIQNIQWADRFTGAILCTTEAAIWMAQIGLVFVVWMAQFSLLFSIGLIKGILSVRR